MKPASTIRAVPFEDRLCHTLVRRTLQNVERELAGLKSVGFLGRHRWTPGKRLRPIVFLLAYLSVQLERTRVAQVRQREVRLAAAVELLHEASLVHDDLVDRSEVRRGHATIQMADGEGLALLIGDYMIFRGLKLILDAAQGREDIVLAQQLANTGLSIAHGEAQQLDRYLHRHDFRKRMAFDDYLDVIAKKTASFFAGCAEAGAALAGAGASLRKVYREFGMQLGIFFQMTDDIIDIIGDSRAAQKSLRNNLAEGTVTLPMIQARKLYPRNPLLRAVARGQALALGEQRKLYQLMSGTEVVAESRSVMEQYVEGARKMITRMPINIYRSGLADLLDYVEICPWGGFRFHSQTPKLNKDGKR
jgi:geranylgeranyl pyrophosphate synthase